MTTRLLLISDTHIPPRARTLPDAVRRLADEADLIVHAGDWVVASVLDELAQHGDVVGVSGNNDDADLRARLPLVAHRRIDRRRQPHHTCMRVTIDDARIEATLVTL